MRNAILIGLGACAIGATIACGPAGVPAELVTETGCITQSNGEFILTDLDAGGALSPVPRPSTEAYLLVGADEQVEQQAGRRVRVVGEADPAEVVNIRVLRPMVFVPPAEPAVAGEDESVPKVGVEDQLRFEVRHLNVQAVDPLDEQCQAIG